MATVIEEQGEHRPAAKALHRAVFGSEYEAELIDRLDRGGLVIASLVALDAEIIVGHVLFSDLAVRIDDRPILAAALAPLAVCLDLQGRGIGARLITKGLRILRKQERAAMIVLGHAGYYRRFGFSAELARKLAGPFKGDNFLALELVSGALAGSVGSVRYPAAFEIEN